MVACGQNKQDDCSNGVDEDEKTADEDGKGRQGYYMLLYKFCDKRWPGKISNAYEMRVISCLCANLDKLKCWEQLRKLANRTADFLNPKLDHIWVIVSLGQLTSVLAEKYLNSGMSESDLLTILLRYAVHCWPAAQGAEDHVYISSNHMRAVMRASLLVPMGGSVLYTKKHGPADATQDKTEQPDTQQKKRRKTTAAVIKKNNVDPCVAKETMELLLPDGNGGCREKLWTEDWLTMRKAAGIVDGQTDFEAGTIEQADSVTTRFVFHKALNAKNTFQWRGKSYGAWSKLRCDLKKLLSEVLKHSATKEGADHVETHDSEADPSGSTFGGLEQFQDPDIFVKFKSLSESKLMGAIDAAINGKMDQLDVQALLELIIDTICGHLSFDMVALLALVAQRICKDAQLSIECSHCFDSVSQISDLMKMRSKVAIHVMQKMASANAALQCLENVNNIST